MNSPLQFCATSFGLGGANYGAQFNVGGDPKKATGYFKTISGTRIDDITITHD